MLRVLILVAVVVGVAFWLLRGRRGGRAGESSAQRAPGKASAPMLECAHCGVHVPRPEACFDLEGRAYCGEAHRLAGPR